MEEESCLEKLKENFELVKEKYSLPEFDDLNKDFQIEKISEEETLYLVRELRKAVGEKISSYLRFIEQVLHPVNAPVFVFTFLKSISSDDKTKLVEMYKKLSKFEVEFVSRDLNFDEEKEAKFVSDAFEYWQNVKSDLGKILDSVNENWDKEFEVNGKDKAYFN